MKEHYSGYKLNDKFLLEPLPTTKRANINKIHDLLRRPFTCEEDF